MSRHLPDIDGTFEMLTGTHWAEPGRDGQVLVEGDQTELHWCGQRTVRDPEGRPVWLDCDGSAFVIIDGRRVPVVVEIVATVTQADGGEA